MDLASHITEPARAEMRFECHAHRRREPDERVGIVLPERGERVVDLAEQLHGGCAGDREALQAARHRDHRVLVVAVHRQPHVFGGRTPRHAEPRSAGSNQCFTNSTTRRSGSPRDSLI